MLGGTLCLGLYVAYQPAEVGGVGQHHGPSFPARQFDGNLLRGELQEKSFYLVFIGLFENCA